MVTMGLLSWGCPQWPPYAKQIRRVRVIVLKRDMSLKYIVGDKGRSRNCCCFFQIIVSETVVVSK